MSTPSAKLNPVTLCLPLGLLPLFLLAGCAGTEVVPVSPLTTLNLQGVVQGGQQPVTDSKLQLYATGTTGDGSTSTALLSQPFQTGSNGEFTISGAYTCPSTASPVYLVATGGNPGLSSGSSNSSIALMAPLGPCGNLSNVPFTTVNEVTTVGSIWPLAPYAKSVAQIGSGNSDAQAFDAAADSINQLISVANGTAPGPMLPAGDVAPTDKLYTLASIIATCVNSTGGSAGDGSACGQLFSSAASGGVPPPSDTIAAALAIAQNPNRNVVDIFDLSPMNGAFQPILSSPPADWTLPILAIPAAPTISPDTGTLASGQTVSIAEDTSGAAVYYTMDGSSPSEASQPYSGPIALTDSGTVSAIAIKASLRSSIASKIFKVVVPVSVALIPGSATLAPAQSQMFTATVANSSNAAVTWSLSSAMGSISAGGLYTAPASITAAQTVTVTATSVADSTKTASAAVSLAPPVSIGLTPGSVTLTPSQTQAFTASVANSSNTAVTWSLSPAVGSISAAGFYTAPASIPASQRVTVTATSVANSTKIASASVSLAPSVSVALTPGSVTLTPSQTQAFTASVSNTPNTAVTWSLSPTMGSISAAGIYTAPASITSGQTVTVTAISAADSTKSAIASVSLAPPVSIGLTPGSVTLTPSQTQAFTASVANSSNTAVTWSLSPAVGTISAGGLYTAPASIPAAQTVTVTATSVADSTKTASAAVSLAPPVSIGLTPGSVTLTPSQTQAFTASVAGTSNTAVTWSLNPAVGSISAGGLYTAPASISSAQTITVKATSVADSTKTASASVSLAPPVSVALTPGSVTLTPSQTQAFTASVAGTSNTAVTWLLSPAVGSISAAGLYTAPASITAAQTLTVTATSVADSTKKASASVSLAPPVSVALTPGSVILTPSQTQAFTATVSNSSNTAVTWSLSPALGSISAAGLYTAPSSIASAQTVTVTATSAANSTKSATATISLTPAVSVALTPGSVTLTPSQTQAFTATVSSTSNTAVTWLLSPAAGSISAAGLYTAPASISSAQTVTVTATSAADSTKSASASVSLAPPVSVALTPGSVTLTPSQTQAFTTTVAGSSNTAVTWSLGPAVGSISAAGLYTAPATVPYPNTVTITATSAANPTKSASVVVTIVPLVGTTYYLAPASLGGNDSNNGLSPIAPWLTPNHAVNCGDVVLAAASTAYSPYNFAIGDWGTVTCTAGNNVAWLKCVTFDACKIAASNTSAMIVDHSYWGVQGWEATTSSGGGACFLASPNSTTPVTIHHIIFANNIANTCQLSGFVATNHGTVASVDYLAIVGNIAYDSTQGNSECFTAISVFQPMQSDSLPGTHIYAAGNFAWRNFDPNPCGGGNPTDGEGLMFDHFDGSQGGLHAPYGAQAVADNNILVGNGGRGFQVDANDTGTGPFASIYIRHNTTWGNNGDLNQNVGYCGELLLATTVTTQAFLNLSVTNAPNGCGAYPIYAYYVGSSATTTNHVYQNWGYAASGTNGGIANSTGFSYGPNNLFGVNPNLANPVVPGTPYCGSYSSVPACMATTIANFTPMNTAAIAYGYQIPSSTPVYDPLFPQWVCNVNLPSGLVTMGCQTEP